jgi:hypothetical protein
MSAHAATADSHGHGSHGDSVFTTAKNWFASKSPSKLNPLSSIDKTGHNLVKGVVENTTWWFSDALNPLWAATKNLGSIVSPGAYKTLGIKNLPKSIGGVFTHVLDSVNNIVSGSTFRWLDHLYTHGITDSIVDITSGTTDRVPLIGKATGNSIKWVNVIPAAPIRFLARAWEKSFDNAIDWMKSFASVGGKNRHLTTRAATADEHH